ncbi:MAG: O-antigen ligase family protein [bacterium]
MPSLVTLELALLAGFVPLLPSLFMSRYFIVLRSHASDTIAAALAITLVLKWAGGRIRWNLNAGPVLMFVLVLYCSVTVSYAHDRVSALHRLILHFDWLVVTSAVFFSLRSKENIVGFLRWTAPGAAAVCIYGVWERLATGQTEISSTMGHTPLYGGYLIVMLFLFQCGMEISEKPGDKILNSSIFALLLINLFLCWSYAALFFFVAGEGLLLTGGWKRSGAGAAALKAAFIALMLTVSFGLIFPWRNAGNVLNLKKKSAELRLKLWKPTLDMIGERPLTGFGAGQYEVFIPRYREKAGEPPRGWEFNTRIRLPVVPENIVLALLAEQGVFGLLIFSGIFAWTFYTTAFHVKSDAGWKRRAAACLGWGAAALLGYAMFHFPFHTPGVWGPAWIMVSLIWGLRDGEPKPPAPPGTQKRKRTALKTSAALAALSLSLYLLYLPVGRLVNDVRVNRGGIHAARGDLKGFRESFENTMPLVPRTWRYYYNYGEGLLSFGKKDEALAAFGKAVRFRPHSVIISRRMKQTAF